MLELFDTHVHLEDSAFDGERDALWSDARAAGVTGAIAVGVHPATWMRSIEIARALGVDCALGIHPEVVPLLDDATLDAALRALPERVSASGAIAIGEIGLDGPAGDLDRQKRALLAQLDVARQLSLPISLHVFKLHGPALTLLRAFGRLPSGGAVHSYSGSSELVRDYVRLGLSISFAGAITRSNARKPIAAAAAVPSDELLIETDAPFQPSGADARDRSRGVPSDLATIARAVADARGADLNEIAALTTANARRVFGQGKNKIG